MRLTAPRSVRAQGRDAFVWTATIGGVAHRIAWSTDDKKIRISWEDGAGWSRFVTLGPAWSPQPDLFAAQAAVESWVERRTATLST
jgi:hypothetical protein